MKYHRRIYYSAAQRAEIWDLWQREESMRSIGRVFDRQSSSVFSVISRAGGIRPADRKRNRQALSPSEREEISRGLSIQQSLRAIARQLGRAVSIKLQRKWSPEQIADWLKRTFPGEAYKQVSHETIYRSLYIQARRVL